MRIVALIPARAGSKRVPGKNSRLLGGRPLIQWTLEAAQDAMMFDEIAVCTDDDRMLAQCSVKSMRDVLVIPRAPVPDMQPDITWVTDALQALPVWPAAFAILRPTSPFRTAETIKRAFALLTPDFHSVRAVHPARETPYKMWTITGAQMWPILTGSHPDGTPYHSSPTQSLPVVYVQNSSLEMGWSINVDGRNSISGSFVRPFFTDGWEGFSIDYPEDWERAGHHVAEIAPLARV